MTPEEIAESSRYPPLFVYAHNDARPVQVVEHQDTWDNITADVILPDQDRNPDKTWDDIMDEVDHLAGH
jgi:hypothetical protein